MAYDEDLANLIRELLATEKGVTEKRMFGGLAFLVGGNMAVAASGQGGLMVRVDPDESETLIAKPHASAMVMRGREMRGWLRVADKGVRTKRQIEPWGKRGGGHARSLPARGWTGRAGGPPAAASGSGACGGTRRPSCPRGSSAA